MNKLNLEDSIKIVREVALERGLFVSSEQAEWVLSDLDLTNLEKSEIFAIIENKLW